MTVKPVPEGYHTVSPYMVVQGAARLIQFVREAFGAEVISNVTVPDGRVMNAEVRIGDSMVMIADAPTGRPAMPAAFYLYVPDTDTVYARAMAAGGTSLMEPADQFYGDRNAGVTDPTGNQWWIATHVEDVAPEELARRARAYRGDKPGG